MAPYCDAIWVSESGPITSLGFIPFVGINAKPELSTFPALPPFEPAVDSPAAAVGPLRILPPVPASVAPTAVL